MRAIIQRAKKDVAIESSLKTYEEVWLSKIFDLRAHSRIKGPSSAAAATHEVGQLDYLQCNYDNGRETYYSYNTHSIILQPVTSVSVNNNDTLQ